MMRNILIIIALFVSQVALADAPVIWSGSTVKWLPSALQSAGVCKLDASGVMTSGTVSDSELGTSYIKADGTRALTGNWNAGSNTITASTFIGALTGNASTASALSSNPAACSASQFVSDIAADGTLTCSQPADVTGNAATATALASNPTDCSANQYATTIAANGNLTCSQPDHGNLAGLSDDDHTQYLLLAGRGTSGQTVTDPITIANTQSSQTALTLDPQTGTNIDFRFESSVFRIDRGATSLMVYNNNMNLNSAVAPFWHVQMQAASTQTTLATYFTRDQGLPVFGIKNSSSTANNASGIAFAGNGSSSTEASSGILGVHESHTGSAETGHLEFWTRNAGTITKRLNIAKDGVHTMSAYGAGVAQFDSSGVISSTAPGTSGNVLTSNGSAWVSSAPAAASVSALSVAAKTSNYTMTNSDDVILCNTTTSIDITMHAVSSATTKSYRIKNIGSGNCNVKTNGSDVFDRITGETSASIAPGGSPTGGFSLIPDSGGSSWLMF